MSTKEINLDQAFQIVLDIARSQVTEKSPTCAFAVDLVTTYWLLNVKESTS